MNKSDMTATDMFKSINGFDEIAIAQQFGEDIGSLQQKNPFRFVRALLFVNFRRQNQSDIQAYNSAMSVSIGDAESYFADEVPEIDEDEPETEQGKDDTLSR